MKRVVAFLNDNFNNIFDTFNDNIQKTCGMDLSTVILIAIAVILAVYIFKVYNDKRQVMDPIVLPNDKKYQCNCTREAEDAFEEGYDTGYVDGVNLTENMQPAEGKETFYDYEDEYIEEEDVVYDDAENEEDDNDYEEDYGARKYQEKTGSKFVKKVGGECPNLTTEVTTGGKWKGKCKKTASWYTVYRGEKDGKKFTCTGGRVSDGRGGCACDDGAGKVWNGNTKKCNCDKGKGLTWNKRVKKCVWSDGKSVETTGCPYGQKKNSSGKCECDTGKGFVWDGMRSRCVLRDTSKNTWDGACARFQVKKDGRCVCDTKNGLMWSRERGDCICNESAGWTWNPNSGKCQKK